MRAVAGPRGSAETGFPSRGVSMESILGFLPSAATVVAAVIVLAVLRRVLERGGTGGPGGPGGPGGTHGFRNQLIMLGVTAVALFVVILVLPMGDAMRGQVLSLIGIVVSAAIALSSTTFLGNAMAGVMMRAVRNFRMGDFIRVEGHFGRVSERGLFHTEIQTEERELTTLPNLYLVTNPVTTIRSSGTVVSVSVSLGYDVPRARIESLLLEAARTAELEDPFVQVLELGDFSVTYRVAGVLQEVKRVVSRRSRLRGCVMDVLHGGGVEIVSPNFMNTRALAAERMIIPEAAPPAPVEPDVAPEDVVFDKAEEAESLEGLRETGKTLVAEIEELEKRVKELPEGAERAAIEKDIEGRRAEGERLQALVAAREAEVPAEAAPPN